MFFGFGGTSRTTTQRTVLTVKTKLTYRIKTWTFSHITYIHTGYIPLNRLSHKLKKDREKDRLKLGVERSNLLNTLFSLN